MSTLSTKLSITGLLLLEIIAALLVSFVLLNLVFLISRLVWYYPDYNFDIVVSQLIYRYRQPWLTSVMFFITTLGSTSVLVLGSLAAGLIIWFKRRWAVLTFIITMTSSALMNNIIKNWFNRPRPVIDPLVSLEDYSYPSGHAMNSIVFYSLIAFYIYYLSPNKSFRPIFWIVSVILVFLIGFSRVYLGVHYPSDVATGWIIGLWWLITALILHKTIALIFHLRNKSSSAPKVIR